MTIKLLITGGTIDKHYVPQEGGLRILQTQIPSMLRQGGVTLPIKIEVIMHKDSLEMTDADRSLVLEKCRSAEERKILITHGTDAMIETAKVLNEADLDKTIILTGAMVPFLISGSDALFNLGGALTAVQLIPMGVYLLMNGRIFHPDEVFKNKVKGRFEPK